MGKLLISILLLLGVTFASGDAVEQSSQLNYGGQLYDKWFEVMPDAKKTTTTHPSYQGDNRKGNTTWRCKECHGWDYKGASGAYSKGSHYSGIKGIQDYSGKSLSQIVKVLTNDTHAYEDILSIKEIDALSVFVSIGQVDSTSFINMKTKKVAGDKIHGAKLYNAICAGCHGKDGKMYNFKKLPKEVYVGDVSRDNPWEILHKIRFGHPGSAMTSLFVLPQQYQIDILAYIQDLK